jgi:hypothetical protein
MDDLNEFEARLRTFRPRQPVPPPTMFLLRRSWTPFWIAAVAVAAAILLAVRVNRPPAAQAGDVTERFTLRQLTTLGLENPDRFDEALTRISRTSLPDVRAPGGALQQLAKF